ncbi:MAG TPA: hypothetical protein VEL07_08915 [Planctomycetota bacterium]|nr:hypothetical protein [Planctomycetota bacterium]
MPEERLPDDIAAAFAAWLDGTCGAADAARLVAWLSAHPRRAGALRDEAGMHVALGVLLAPAAEGRDFARAVSSHLAAADGVLPDRVMTSIRGARAARRARPIVAGAFALAAIAAAALIVVILGAGARVPAEAPATEATISGTAVVDGLALAPGDRRELTAGAIATVAAGDEALISDRDGTVATIRGAATLRADGPARLSLERGAAIAARSAPRSPWRIATPHAEVALAAMTIEVDADCTWIAADAAVAALVAGRPLELPVGAMTISASGVVRREAAGAARTLDRAAARVDRAFDACAFAPAPGSRRGLPLASFTYAAPSQPTFASVVWPVTLADDETGVAMWIRASRVSPAARHAGAYVALVVAQDGADHLVAQVQVFPGDDRWLRLSGRLATARLNWSRPGEALEPLAPASVRTLALRAYLGSFEATITAPEVLRTDASDR